MKLFDYKFLILLVLVLVVYFLYRELLDLKSKMKTLENNLSNDLKKIEQINEPLVQETNEISNNELFRIPLPLPPQNLEVKREESNVILETKEDSEEDEILSGENLAIYSNDNDKTNTYSLGDSSELEVSEINELEVSEDIQNIDDDDEKKKIILVKSEGDDNLKGSSEKSSINTAIVIDNLPISEMVKLKLNELQCYAEEIEIDLVNKEKNKRKTKSELSNEIFNYYQNKQKIV